MTRLEAALVEVVGIFEYLEIPYMLIGGLAVAQWGEPRATLDLDFTVWVEPQELERTLAELVYRLASRTAHPMEFVERTRVLPVQTRSGVPVDIIFAMWPVEQEAITAAARRSIGGVEVRVACRVSSLPQIDFGTAERLGRCCGVDTTALANDRSRMAGGAVVGSCRSARSAGNSRQVPSHP